MSGFNYGSLSNAAIMLKDISYIFYVNEDKNLAYLWYQGKETKGGSKSGSAMSAYTSRTVLLDNNPVKMNPDTPQVTAVSYETGCNYHVRVYYINGDGNLRELYFDTENVDMDPKWQRGSLSELNLNADAKTPLSSLVQVGGIDQLKVYYKSAAKDYFNCAYSNIGMGNWSTRELFNKGARD